MNTVMIPFMIFSIVRYSCEYIITIWSSDDYIIEIEKNNDIILQVELPNELQRNWISL